MFTACFGQRATDQQWNNYWLAGNNITGSKARAGRVNQQVQSKVLSKVLACLPVGLITVLEYQVNYWGFDTCHNNSIQQRRTTTAVSGPQNTLFPSVSVNNWYNLATGLL
jgi:hypothetical protein